MLTVKFALCSKQRIQLHVISAFDSARSLAFGVTFSYAVLQEVKEDWIGAQHILR